MHYVYLTLIVLFSAIIVIFTFQNFEPLTLSFLAASITLPRSALIVIIYILGMFTGGFVTSLIKRWIRGARKPAGGTRERV